MRNKIIVCLFFLWLGFAGGSAALAAENSLGLDDQNHYDIYLSGYGDSLTVIRNVDILSLKEFGGQTFLLIRTDTFNAKRSEGLLNFASIRAVLPAGRANLDVVSAEISTSPKMKYYTPQGQ